MPADAAWEDLRRWVVAQRLAGCSDEDLLTAMHASGWDEATAQRALHGAVAHPAGGPGVATDPGQSQLDIDGRRITVLCRLRRPPLVVMAGLLSEDECEALMALAAPRLARSETVDTRTGASEVNAARTSEGMFFQRGENPLCQRIEARIERLLGWPVDHGEGLQVLRYGPGAEYKPHYDYFDPTHPGTPAVLRRGGQRLGTLLMYLNTPTCGGATVFPDAGLEVHAVRGHAVFFAYPQAEPASLTLHGGAPVVEGEKWVATKWLRAARFE